MTDQRPGGHNGNKKWEDWDRFFSILQKEDPHQRLRGIHNGKKMYDHTEKWVTHASLQTSDLIRAGCGIAHQLSASLWSTTNAGTRGTLEGSGGT